MENCIVTTTDYHVVDEKTGIRIQAYLYRGNSLTKTCPDCEITLPRMQPFLIAFEDLKSLHEVLSTFIKEGA